MKQLTIGKLAKLTGVTADTLRYYEKMKLLKAEARSAAGYRLYSPDMVHVVRFIRGAKALNFRLDEIRKLMALNTSDQASCAQVLKHTEAKMAEAETKIKELKEIKRVLAELVKCCPGDATPVECCPIMEHIRKTKTAFALLLVVSIACTVPKAEAKPISYVGGIMAMQENDETGHSFALDYTFDPHYAVGWFDRWEENEKGGKDYSIHSPEFNTLIQRWNLPEGQAVEKIRDAQYDIVFMDCQMPEMDGFEATRKIREEEVNHRRHTVIVALTADAMQGDREKCLKIGMDDYLNKPLKAEQITEMLRKWINREV